MAKAIVRVTVLMTAKAKALVIRKAKKLGLSTGEYLRRAAESFNPAEDVKALEFLVSKMTEATERAGRAIEETLAFVDASNRRLDLMEARRKTD